MSYTRSTVRRSLSGVRRSLSGVTSQPPGRPVSRRALPYALSGDDLELVAYKDPRPIFSHGRIPRWVRDMQSVGNSSLGDDTLDATTAYQQEALKLQRDLLTAHKTWADGDRFQKWLAIGATLAIPLSAAIWRALGIGRRRSSR